MTLDEELTETMKALSRLSNSAKEAGAVRVMYAANRAWHHLFQVRQSAARTPQESANE